MGTGSRAALFADRDGTIIEDVGFVRSPDQVRLLPGAAEGLRLINASGHSVVVISNQSGVGRGMFDLTAVWAVDAEMRRQLDALGARVSGSYYCPHHPDDGCACRKPGTELLVRAAAELDLDLARSWMVGDRQSDLDAGVTAGCRVAAYGFRPVDADVRVVTSLVELAEVFDDPR